MDLKLVRIDFRLIHGQVITRWVGRLGADHIMVVDDRSYSSAILKKILLGAAPAGVKVFVESVETGAQRWKDGDLEGNLIILFKDTATAARAYAAGMDFKELQIGGVEGAGDKKNVYRNIVLSQKDVDNLKPLLEDGVVITCRPIPEDDDFLLKNALDKFD